MPGTIKHNIHTVRKSVFKPVPEDDAEPTPEPEARAPMSDLYTPNPKGFTNTLSSQSYGRRAAKLPTVKARRKR